MTGFNGNISSSTVSHPFALGNIDSREPQVVPSGDGRLGGHSIRGGGDAPLSTSQTWRRGEVTTQPRLTRSLSAPTRLGGGETIARQVGPRHIGLERNRDGSVQLRIDRPAIRQLVFSGGGAKGAAYPGAIQALQQQGVLAGVKTLSGSSAGAITASVLACGLSAEEFTELSNTLDFQALVGGRFQAEATGLENVIRDKGRESVLGHIGRYLESHAATPALTEIRNRLQEGGGVTFGDLRTLSRLIPEIKELRCTGTAMIDGHGQLAVFSADATPDMDIAKAAHISGSFPYVFRQVEHEMPYGLSHHFQDGGVMLNIPVDGIVDPEVAREPLPSSDQIVFGFESEGLRQVISNHVPEKRGGLLSRLKDWVVGADNSARGYFQQRELQNYRDQLVMVRLTNEEGSFTGLKNGTLNFGMSESAKRALQRDLAQDVGAHLQRRQDEPLSVRFESLDQALYALDESDLQALLLSDDLSQRAAITNALQFRRDADRDIDELTAAVASQSGGRLDMGNEALSGALARLDRLADGNPDKLAYLARRLNRPEATDAQRLLDHGRYHGDAGSRTLGAALQEAGRRDARTAATTLVRELVYPARFRAMQSGHNAVVLSRVEAALRRAESRAEINAALDDLIANYRHRSFLGFGEPSTVTQARAARFTTV